MKRTITILMLMVNSLWLFGQTNYYVATNGNNANPGTEALPFRTIQKGADMAQAGETVYVKAGTYNEEVSITNSGTAGNPVKLMAYPGDELNVIIDGTGINVSNNSGWPYFSGLIGAYGKSYVEVSGFTIQNSNGFGMIAYEADNITFSGNYTYNTAHSGIASFEYCTNIYILDNEVVFAVNGGQQECISVATTDGFEVGYNKVHDAAMTGVGGEGIDVKDGSANGQVYYNEIWNTPDDRCGIYIDAYEKHTYNIEIFGNIIRNSRHFGMQLCSEKGGLLENIKIYNNLIYNSKRGGVQFFDESSHAGPEPIRNIEIYNNTFYNNSPTINWWGGITNNSPYLTDITIYNNIFANNNAYQVFDAVGVSGWSVSNNLLIGDLGAQDQSRLNVGDDLLGDPEFVDAGNFDFHLLSSSPAIDNGMAVFVTTDFDGNTRPSGEGWDIGAFEFSQGPACNPTITISGENTLCSSGQVTLDAGVGFASYLWSTGETTQSIQAGSAGSYTVITTDNDGCEGTAGVEVTFPAPLNLNIVVTNATGGNNGSADLTVSGGTPPYSYLWSTGQTSQDISGLAPGTYNVIVTDAHGCNETVSATIVYFEPTVLAFEHGIAANVSTSWQTVSLNNQYNSPVVIATVHLASAEYEPVVARVRNATSTGFELKIQGAGTTVTDTYNVHYFVVEEGTYSEMADGIKMEARKVNSAKTARSGNWQFEARSYENTYSNPVVLGQVMTENDNDWSVFWASGNNARTSSPSTSDFACGKHIGEANALRVDETIGYVVFEAGTGQISGTGFLAGLGSDIVRGPTNNSNGYSYDIGSITYPETAVVSAAGMDGGDGGWPVLFTNQPLGPGNLVLAFDEDREKDLERNHTTEQVAFIVFEGEPQPINPPTIEYNYISNVSSSWQTIALTETFTSPVIVATPVIQSNSDPTVLARIKNVTSSSFDIKVESLSGVMANVTVYFVVVEEGVYNVLEHGVKMEAVVATTDLTAHKNNWVFETRTYQNSYQNPVILGQVMSANDNWSVFWSSGSNNKNTPASSAGFAAGKHVGEDPLTSRAGETIGYFVFEKGNGNIGNYFFEAGLSNDYIKGLDNSSSGYSVAAGNLSAIDAAVLSAAKMDGNDGGFPVLFGNSPMQSASLRISFAEDQLKDNERYHTTEQIAFLALGTPAEKSGEIMENNIVAFSPLTITQNLWVYPNPASDYINLKIINAPVEPAQIQIYDSFGRLVYKGITSDDEISGNKIFININTLPRGLYYVSVVTLTSSVTGKFIRQ
jgi:hypothetical protein